MRSFKFRLEAVLAIRESERDAAYRVYAKAMQARRNMETNIEVAFQGYSLLADNLAQSRSHRISAASQGQVLDAMEGQKKYIMQAQEEVLQLEAHEKECLQRYLKAKQRYEMLVKLKDKRLGDHQLLMRQYEEKVLDDIVSARHCRAS